MNFLLLIQNEYFIAIIGAIGGGIITYLTQVILNRRGTFTYFVNHQRVGLSVNDAIHGSVAVSWNGTPISNLYLSTIDLINKSINDYEDVIISAYTDNTMLLSEQTQILETPNIIEWTDKYKQRLHSDIGSSLTDLQWSIYYGQREYLVPIMNRGQSVRLIYLSSANENTAPNIWLAITKKGVKLKYSVPQNQILGVPQPQAAFLGVFIGLAVVVFLVLLTSNIWIVAFIALTFGFVAQLPGAYIIKLFRKLKEVVSG